MMYSLITPDEAQHNERLRQAPRRRCAACGSRLNCYAASTRLLCTLCLHHDTEARLICARRRMAGYRATADPGQLADIEADALHEALWRMASAELADDLRVVPVGGERLPGETPVGVPRTLVAIRQRIRGIYYADADGRRDPDAFFALQEEGYLVHAGYAAWSGVATLWSVYAIYPRCYDQLGDR